MAQLPAVAHIALTVADLAVSITWYERLLNTRSRRPRQSKEEA